MHAAHETNNGNANTENITASLREGTLKAVLISILLSKYSFLCVCSQLTVSLSVKMLMNKVKLYPNWTILLLKRVTVSHVKSSSLYMFTLVFILTRPINF